MEETVIGIITPTEGKGKGGVRWGGTIKRFALIFTTNRVIIVKLAGFLTILAGGLGGTLGQLYARMHSVKPSDLVKTSFDDFLQSDKDNYVIPYSDVVKVEMKKGRFFSNPGIFIVTKAEKHVFGFLNDKELQNYVNIVTAALSEKVTISK